jgi:hypothetical protein
VNHRVLTFLLTMAPLCAAAPLPAQTPVEPSAAQLVASARARRAAADSSIAAYTTLVRERLSVGMQMMQRDRLLVRRELAARLHWRRGEPARMEILGARSAVPMFVGGVRAADVRDAGYLIFHPGQDHLLVGLEHGSGSTFETGTHVIEENSHAARHPLAPGAEAHYRYEVGDTTTIRLHGGRVIRLIELRVHPRREEFTLVRGSFWLDADTHDLVRAVYRPARAFDLDLDAALVDDDDLDDVPGVLKPIRGTVERIVLEYGLWEQRWWLPRLMLFDIRASAGNLLRLPVVYERSYEGYDVEGFTSGAVLPPIPRVEVGTDTTSSGRVYQWRGCPKRPGLRVEQAGDVCVYYTAVVPDSSTLLTSELLPPSIFAQGEQLVTEGELEDLRRVLDRLPRADPDWRADRPVVRWGLGAPGLVRYNRVEALSMGATVAANFGRARADLTGRVGIADFEPNGELGIESDVYAPGVRAAAYRRLATVDERTRALGLGNSASALLFGVDEGDYYRALGVEIGTAPDGGSARFTWRLFAERQRAAGRHTDVSLRSVFTDDTVFRPATPAADADQVGAVVALRHDRGLDPAGLRWGVASRLETAAGSFDYARPAVALYAAFPVAGPLVAGAEVEAGWSFGTVAPQRRWFLGGPATLRGFAGAAATGESFWRGRLELATSFPGARVALFSDAGWAGDRDSFLGGRPLLSAGIGASLLDGVIRLDLARAVRGGLGWRGAIYLDGLL